MTLQQMYYLLVISESCSMNKAAEKLYIAQPTLTNAVKEAEQEIGMPIFLRTSRGVTPTAEGREFLTHIREVYQQYNNIIERFSKNKNYRRKFSVSMQHYSFAVQAFINMTKSLDHNQFDMSIRETQTMQVIQDVGELKSEIGVIYISELNRKVIQKLFHEHELEFHSLIVCQACVYLAKSHPLAKEKILSLEQLEEYPCLSFEQGGEADIYLAEEFLTEYNYEKTIKATDRATMMNLLIGLNGYTLCSNIYSEAMGGEAFITIPLKCEVSDYIMNIGYIQKKNAPLTPLAKQYVIELQNCLKEIS